ncbi:hypothetical protein [Domibacillus iocasae]|uniref:Uncharacterized protein n=1 Tax=Domibacillus iocasae TaxID=1714016 RepID=A0A1E7DME7_9BACI|nr:hypothetical protein [Domibacillus iocasae]OES43858.1 hypothetical protein BA724_12250 [Domibacillus iocasae]
MYLMKKALCKKYLQSAVKENFCRPPFLFTIVPGMRTSSFDLPLFCWSRMAAAPNWDCYDAHPFFANKSQPKTAQKLAVLPKNGMKPKGRRLLLEKKST